MGWTNRGKARCIEYIFRRQWNAGAAPTDYYVALVTSATAPTTTINTLSELTEIAAGNGYTSGGGTGGQLTAGTTDWESVTENDGSNLASIQAVDAAWTASGGSIPGSGSGARYAVLTDDNGTVGSREVLMWWDLTSDRTVSDGQTLTLQDLEVQIKEPA